jgi:hypothetical protein
MGSLLTRRRNSHPGRGESPQCGMQRLYHFNMTTCPSVTSISRSPLPLGTCTPRCWGCAPVAALKPCCSLRYAAARLPRAHRRWCGSRTAAAAAATTAAVAGTAATAAAAVMPQLAAELAAAVDEAPVWTLDQAVGLVFGGLLLVLYLSSSQVCARLLCLPACLPAVLLLSVQHVLTNPAACLHGQRPAAEP